jgi:hypothetical protein
MKKHFREALPCAGLGSVLCYHKVTSLLMVCLFLVGGLTLAACDKKEKKYIVRLDEISPLSVSPGDEITLTGEYLNHVSEVIFTDNVPVNRFESQSRKELKVKVPVEARTGTIIISDGSQESDLIYSKDVLTVALPTYTSSSAVDVKAGDELTFTGENLDWIKAVRFHGGAEVSELTVSADGTTLTVTVPAQASSGAVELITYSGIAIAAGVVTTPVPTELSVSPTPVKNGANLTITGKNLDLVASVTFPNVTTATQPISVTATQIVVKVEEKAQDGDITLTLINGESVTVLYRTLKPTIMAFDPPVLSAGEKVSITGTDLDLVTAVIFAGEGEPTVTIAPENYVDETTLRMTVPMTAQTCAPRLKMYNGMTTETDVTLEIDPVHH